MTYWTGRKQTAEHIAKRVAALHANGTYEFSEQHRRNLSAYWRANPEKHNRYVDGKSAERNGARNTDMRRLEYRLWREKVFERDNWTCVICGERGVKLHADHILPYCSHESLRYDLDNGRTVCVACHIKLPTYGPKARQFMVVQRES